MESFLQLTTDELQKKKFSLEKDYKEFQSRNLKLDMTRGKPSPEQLDISNEMLSLPGRDRYKTENGTDSRNYGGVEGIPEMRRFFAEYLGLEEEEIIIGGNSSLSIMHDTVVRALMFGVPDGSQPWKDRRGITFLCPSPGYDRHFAICEHFGIKMATVAMDENGPDMDAVERLVQMDENIKGIWCVPKYSNPTGIIYSDEVVKRLAKMKCAAPDFRIFWDNAYAVHHLGYGEDALMNILHACIDAGNPNRPLIFASTSKITFAGAGIAAMGASKVNIQDAINHLSMQTIGPDKINQLRHLTFIKDMKGLKEIMNKHAGLLRPKFDAVDEVLSRELEGTHTASWSKPRGGYFVSLDTLDGCAKRVVALASEAGVKLTGAGATFPYKKDPEDRNIRISPSLPSLKDIRLAMECLSICIKLASVEKLLES